MDPDNNYKNSTDKEYLERATKKLVETSEFASDSEFLQQIERYAPGWIVHRADDYEKALNKRPFKFREKWKKLCDKIQTDLSMERENLMKENPDTCFPPINVEQKQILIVKNSPVTIKPDETLMRWVTEELTKKGYQVRNINEFTVCKGTGKVIFSADFADIYQQKVFDGYAEDYKGDRKWIGRKNRQ